MLNAIMWAFLQRTKTELTEGKYTDKQTDRKGEQTRQANTSTSKKKKIKKLKKLAGEKKVREDENPL